MKSNLKLSVEIANYVGSALVMVLLLFVISALMMTTAFSVQVLWRKNMNSYQQMLSQQKSMETAVDGITAEIISLPKKCFVRFNSQRLFLKSDTWWQNFACKYQYGLYYLIEPYECDLCLSSVPSQCIYRVNLFSIYHDRRLKLRVMVSNGMLNCGAGIVAPRRLAWERII